MGLMDFLERAAIPVATGYIGARVEQMETSAKAKADKKKFDDELKSTVTSKIKIQDAELDKKATLEAEKENKLAKEAYRIALGELGDEGMVEMLKRKGKLKSVEHYEAWKTKWRDYTGHPQFWTRGDFINDFKTSGQKLNTPEVESNLMDTNNLSTNIVKSQVEGFVSPTIQETVKTGEVFTKKIPDIWHSKYAKKTTSTTPTTQYLMNTETGIPEWVTNEQKILSSKGLYVPIADPVSPKYDLSPFGDKSVFAGIYTDETYPGIYFKNLQFDISDEKNITAYLNKNKGHSITNEGYILDKTGNVVPVTVPVEEIQNLEAIDKIDNYRILDPSKNEDRKILSEWYGINSDILNSYAANKKVIQIPFELINDQFVPSGKYEVLDVSVANQKFDTSRLTIEKGINKELANYFSDEYIQYLPETQDIQFFVTAGSLEEGRKFFFLNTTARILNEMIAKGIAPSAKNITKKTSEMAELVKYGIYYNEYSDDAIADAKKLAGNTTTMAQLKLLQSYFSHFGKAENLKKHRQFFLNTSEDRLHLPAHFNDMANKLYKLIIEATLLKEKERIIKSDINKQFLDVK